jgi:hypothetical protein
MTLDEGGAEPGVTRESSSLKTESPRSGELLGYRHRQ